MVFLRPLKSKRSSISAMQELAKEKPGGKHSMSETRRQVETALAAGSGNRTPVSGPRPQQQSPPSREATLPRQALTVPEA